MPVRFLAPLIVSLGLLATNAASAAPGDPVAGKRTFAQCAACHSLVKGKSGVGPSLNGVVGRKAGTTDGFKTYSPAMQKAGLVWTEENLTKYLRSPKTFIPGNRMTFVGLKKDEDAANVIAYLKQAAQE